MDDDLQTLEMELKRLRPLAPRARLSARIEAGLAPARQRPVRADWRWLFALSAAAAVAVLLALSWNRPTSTTTGPNGARDAAAAAAEPAFKPVAVENVLYAARDEGVVTLEDGTPAVRQRLNYVDTIIWRDPRTNASVRWSVPREEIRVVPVSLQ